MELLRNHFLEEHFIFQWSGGFNVGALVDEGVQKKSWSEVPGVAPNKGNLVDEYRHL